VGFSSYTISTNIVDQKISDSILNSITQVNLNIRNMMRDVEILSDFYCYNADLKKAIEEEDLFKANEKVNDIFRNVNVTYKEVNNYTTILAWDGRAFINWMSDGKDYYRLKQYIESQDWYENIISQKNKIVWIPTHKNIDQYTSDSYVLTAGRVMSDIYKNYGLILISIPETDLWKILKSFRPVGNSEIYVIDQNGRNISHCDANKRMVVGENQPYIQNILQGEEEEGAIVASVHGEKRLVVFQKVPKTQWTTIATLPLAELNEESHSIRNAIIVSSILSLIAAFFLAYLISRGIVKPIRQMEEQMRRVEQGDFDAYVDVTTSDEIGRIGEKFNVMVAKIKDLMDRVVTEEKKQSQLLIKQREAELELLRAQINPHFLFNTLNSIKCMALINQANHIAEMISALGRLLENSIQRGKDMITLEEEIENLKNYVLLQQMRYGNKLRILYDMDPELLTLEVPRLILQPIVENAIIHGLEKKTNGGQIQVYGRRKEEVAEIVIEDNGVGMSQEEVENLRTGLDPTHQRKSFSGIGIKNVDERIRLVYGEDYGLTITSKINVGTKVILVIPRVGRKRGTNDEDTHCR
ncbi:MAG: sensor histidine kinase, partial [Epulopiscium sp.]|nr:sensor histidine kinase [Candidatus Epulonipiscium sp.]